LPFWKPSELIRELKSRQSVKISAQRSLRAFHIPGLDGIRALSFLIVFLSHDDLDKIIPGLFGVAVFFFLSGYLITTLMRIEIDSTDKVSIKDFYVRRALRIFPSFYLTVLLIVLIVKAGLLGGTFRGADLTATAVYLTNYWDIFVHPVKMPGFNVFWSLSVEEHFYLIFPFLMLTMHRFRMKRSTQALFLLALCAIALAWRCILIFGFHVNNPLRTMYATDTRMDAILFGCVLALWGNPILDSKPKYSWALTIGGVFLLLVSLLYRNPVFRETFRYTLQGVGFIPLFTSAVQFHEHWTFRWLNSWPLRFLGTLSYSLYLVHLPIIYVLRKCFSNRLLVGVTGLVISIAVAYVFYVAVERPFARLRKRLGSRTAQVRA
jgi:peptidoglycan/LPS O-acetylase OafA/YrhL